MLDALGQFANDLLGLDAESLGPLQMAVRAVLTFAVTIAVVRLGDKRIFGKGTTFDLVVSIMIGSVMSRAITGSSPLFATWVAGLVLVGMHWALAALAYHLSWFGSLIKGNAVLLIEDGRVLQEGMREASLSRLDLEQALRLDGREPDPSKVERSYLERNGDISIIPCPAEPKVVAVAVADGVQTVRIALK